MDRLSFADHLRSWSPQALGRLLEARPDLLASAEEGFEALAAAAASPGSVSRALLGSDVAMLVAADALVVLSPTTVDEIDTVLGTEDLSAVLDAIERLATLGLAVVDDPTISPGPGVADLLRRPLGLGRSIIELWPHLSADVADRLTSSLGLGVDDSSGTSAADVDAAAALRREVARRLRQPLTLTHVLEDAPAATVELLEGLVEQRAPSLGLPTGHLYRDLDAFDPLTWMLANGLLVAVGDGVAEMPREIVIASSPQGLAPRAAMRSIPVRPVAGLGADMVQASASDAAAKVLEAADALIRIASEGEISIRKAGGVGVREVRRLGKLVDLPIRDVGRLLELLVRAALFVPGGDRVMVVPAREELWWSLSRARRWGVLARAWMACPYFPSQALAVDELGETRPALNGWDAFASAATVARRTVLAAIEQVGSGDAFNPEQIAEVVVWQSPHVWGIGDPPPEELVDWTLVEAQLLGLVALHAPGPAIGALLDDDGALDEVALSMLGDDQATIVIQSDLTAVALGPLEPAVAGRLAELADRVAKMSVPTYRFTEESIRRGMDKGWSVEEIETFLAEHALSGLPQPLRYLIADVERRYGSVRVVTTSTILLTEDEAEAIEIASSPKMSSFELRLLAPKVLASVADPVRVMQGLHAAGFFPVFDGREMRIAKRGLHVVSGPVSGSASGSAVADGKTEGHRPSEALPADWIGPPLDDVVLPGEIGYAVEMLLSNRDDPTR